MLRWRAPLLSLVLAAAVAACGDDSAGLGDAQMRFINAAATAPSLDFTIDGQTVASNVAVGTATQCQRVRARFSAVRAVRAGTNTTFAPVLNFTFAPQAGYAAIAMGNDTINRLAILSDAALAPSQGRGRLRVINGIPSAVNTDVFVTAPGATLGTASQAAVPWGTPTIFFDAPAGQTQIRFRSVAATGAPATVFYTGDPFEVVAGTTRTIVITPGATPGTFRTTTFEGC